MKDRGHISAVMHNATRTDTHTHLCCRSWMNKPVMQRTNSRTTSLFCLFPLLLLALRFPPCLFTETNQVCIWHSLLPLPVTSGMKEWVRDRGKDEGERRGNSQSRRQRHRHSWGVNSNNRSLLSHPVRIRSKMPGGRYDPETYTRTDNRHTQSLETAG